MTSARVASLSGSQPSPVFGQPSGGILLTVDRRDADGTIGTGSVNVASGIIMPEGRCTDVSQWSLWTVEGVEVSRWMQGSAFTHPDGSFQSVLVKRAGDIVHGTQFWLRNIAPTVTPEASITPPREPAAYFMAQPDHACPSLPHPFKLPTWTQANGLIDTSQWAWEYTTWILNDDWIRNPDGLMDGGLRNAIYGRAHNLNAMGLMRAEAPWHAKALKIMNSGTGAAQTWLQSLFVNDIGGLGGFETILDMSEVHLCYLVSHCADYLTALQNGTKQLHDIARLGDASPDGTYWNLRNGFERALARAFDGSLLVVGAGLTATAADYSHGAGTGVISAATIETKAANVMKRYVAGTGEAPDEDQGETGNLARSAGNTARAALLSDLLQRNPNGTTVTIPAQDIILPAGATMGDTGQDRVICVGLSWDGAAIVCTPGTAVTYNASTHVEPFTALWPTFPSRRFAHIVIMAAAGTAYVADTTVLPATYGATLSGITIWYHSESRIRGQKAYMLAQSMRALMRYYHQYPSGAQRTAALTAIGEILDKLWADEWQGSEPSTPQFNYGSVNSSHNGRTASSSAMGPSLNLGYRALNSMVAHCASWYGWVTASQTWKDRAKVMTDGAYTIAFDTSAGWCTPVYVGGGDLTVNDRTGDEAHEGLWSTIYYRLAAG